MTTNFIQVLKGISKDNKYLKYYIGIITKAKSRPHTKKELIKELEYVELHHIVPNCLFINTTRPGLKGYLEGNPNDKNNLVYLSAREHFICHMLLIKLLKQKFDRMRLAPALYKMSGNGGKYFNSRTYQTAKTIASKNSHMKLEKYRSIASNTIKTFAKTEKGIIFYQNKAEIQKITMVGEGNPMFGKQSAFKGKSHSEEFKLKLKNKTGDSHHNKDKKMNYKKFKLQNIITKENIILDSRLSAIKYLKTTSYTFDKSRKYKLPINGYYIFDIKENSPKYIATKNNIEYQVYNLKQFCEEHELHYQSMVKVAGKYKPQHKGWKLKKEW